MVRSIIVDDVADVRDVEPAGRDVRADEQLDLIVAERVERGHAGALIEIAMQRADREAVLLQRAIDDLHVALAVAEDDGVLEALGAADQMPQRGALRLRGDARLHQRLGDVGRRGSRPRDFDANRVLQELLGEPGDFRRHGRGEEQRLPGEGDQLADAFDVGDEAHVEHPVGFVDHQDFDGVEQDFSALGEVQQSARRGDQHVSAAHDLGFLIAKRNAADQQRDIEFVIDAVSDERLFDLVGEFARWLEDKGSRHPRPGAAFFEQGQHRQRESGGLAGSGLRDSEDVAALQRVRYGLFLDRRRRVVAGRLDGFEHFLAQA